MCVTALTLSPNGSDTLACKSERSIQMRQHQSRRTIGSIAAIAAVGLAVLVAALIISPRGQAAGQRNAGNDEASEIQQGFAIAPVPLNLEGRNRALVGLGSYIVNA